MKLCRKCGDLRDATEFYNSKNTRDGKHSVCIECSNAAVKLKRKTNKEWRDAQCLKSKKYKEEHPDRYTRGIRNSTLKKKYGIGIKEYDELFAKQNGRCAICGSQNPGVSWTKNLHVDHDHTTGKIRGLLCQPCNVSLGKVNESIDVLRKMIAYLENSH